jgi:MFS family permease
MQIGIWGMLGNASVLTALLIFMPLLAEERGIRGAGIAFSVYALAELSGHPIGGRIGQSVGRRPVIMAGLLTAAIGVLTLRQAQTTALLYAGAAASGFGVAILRVSLDTLVFEGAPDDLRATAAGLEYAGMDGWNGMLSWIVGLVVAAAGYDAAYGLMAAIPLVWIAVMWVLVPPRAREAILRPVPRTPEAAADR